MNKVESLYSCETLAQPILHDTVLRLMIEREILGETRHRLQSFSSLLDNDVDLDSDCSASENVEVKPSLFSVTGQVLKSLGFGYIHASVLGKVLTTKECIRYKPIVSIEHVKFLC